MAEYEYWMDPPRNTGAGGCITWEKNANDSYKVDTENVNYYVGFKCQKNWFFPLDLISDHYESYSYHTFMKFELPTITSGVLTDARLHLMLGNAMDNLSVNPIYIHMNVYYKDYETIGPPFEFPWQPLVEGDYSLADWVLCGAVDNFYEYYASFLVSGIHWIPSIDVLSGVALAYSKGWQYVALKLSPSYDAPIDWDYEDQYHGYNEECWVAFYGAQTPYWTNTPTGHPNTYDHPSPWLELIFSGGVTSDEQTEPGEITHSGSLVLCVAADPKAKQAIAGTQSGNLWYTWSGGADWDKVYECGEPITAVAMDYVRNFKDYPGDEIAFFGTQSGHLYRNIHSLSPGDWKLVKTFDSPVVEIRISDMSSNKVVCGVEDEVWTSANGGTSWIRAKDLVI